MNDDIWRDHESRLVRMVVRAAGRIAGRAATLGGARKPLEWLEDEFFTAMADEVEEAGVKRRVAAGMFGASRRTFQRRLSAAHSRLGEVGASLWWLVHEELVDGPRTEEEVLAKFARRPPDVVSAILRDMVDSGWVIERDGSYEARPNDEAWSKARVLQLAEALKLFESDASFERLSRHSGVPPDQLREWLGDPSPAGVVKGAEDEAKWLVLTAMLQSVLHMAFQRLAGDEGGDGKLWRVQFAEGQRELVAKFESVVAEKGAELDAAYHRFVDHAKREDAGAIARSYVVTLIETDQGAHGWTDL